MLKRFEVKNFKNFKENFVFDLTDTKNYDFNKECVKDGMVSKGIIYGPNGCGKSNLGHAIFDIKNHIFDNNVWDRASKNYLNADSNANVAKFCYMFTFGKNTLLYKCSKSSPTKVIYEELLINNEQVLYIDRDISDTATVNLEGAETLNKDLSTNKEISLLKYVLNNTVLINNTVNQTFDHFLTFIKRCVQVESVNHNFNEYNQQKISDLIITYDFAGFKNFIKELGIKDQLTTYEVEGKKRLAIQYTDRKVDFFQVASTGTISFCYLYTAFVILNYHIESKEGYDSSINPTFIFIDEFDAFYHFKAAKAIVKKLKEINAQVILTTHNTSIMSNDLLRPDCYFVMENDDIKPTFRYTEKELRKAHNIEKLFRGGVFSNE